MAKKRMNQTPGGRKAETDTNSTGEERRAKIRVRRRMGYSLNDVFLQYNKKLAPQGIVVLIAHEHEDYSTYFAVLDVKSKDSRMPSQDVLISPEDFHIMTKEELHEEEERVFSRVRTDLRCPTCWGRDKGRSRLNCNTYRRRGKTLIYCKCNMCGREWKVEKDVNYTRLDSQDPEPDHYEFVGDGKGTVQLREDLR